ncbi:MAG TPA: translation elongation factor Ts [Gemmatimonadales bacterium]|nr:translation elongation factor Ts [Gemmatimonadales bacterium]
MAKEISAKDVAALRARTGAGMMDCKKALEEAGGDMEKAVDILRKKGTARADKRAERTAAQGVITSYIHHNGKVGVLLELNCETDFVANTEDFRNLARDVAMHIAAANPIAVSPDGVPADVVAREKAIYLEQARESGKPAAVQEKMAEGKLKKFYEERVLLEQLFVRDDKQKVGDLVKAVSGKVGEKVVVRRFVRFGLGGD